MDRKIREEYIEKETKTKRERYNTIVLLVTMLFTYFLLENALTEYATHLEGLQKDSINSLLDIGYLILFGFIIVEFVNPKIKDNYIIIMMTIFLIMYMYVRGIIL